MLHSFDIVCANRAMLSDCICCCCSLVLLHCTGCSGLVSTFAGSGTAGWQDGVGTAAKLSTPISGYCDSTGSLFVVDNGNSRIRKITSAGLTNALITCCSPLAVLMSRVFGAGARRGDYFCWIWRFGAGGRHWHGGDILLAARLLHRHEWRHVCDP